MQHLACEAFAVHANQNVLAPVSRDELDGLLQILRYRSSARSSHNSNRAHLEPQGGAFGWLELEECPVLDRRFCIGTYEPGLEGVDGVARFYFSHAGLGPVLNHLPILTMKYRCYLWFDHDLDGSFSEFLPVSGFGATWVVKF